MRRILLRVWILAMAFGLGISVSALWRLYKLYQLPAVSEVIVSDPPPHTPLKAPPLRIVGVIDACGPESNRHVYELSDGSRITTICETFTSRAGAARALKAETGLSQVVDRSMNLDERGRSVGETILITTPRVFRLSTYEKNLCVTEAPSLRHLQWIEGNTSP